MLSSIVILSYNNLEYTKACIESIRRFTKKESYEIIVVDNNSSNETVEWLQQQEDLVCVFNDFNAGFPGGCNIGMREAKGDNILLLNNDTIVTENWLENLLVALYSDKEIAAVGPVTNSCSNFQTIPCKYSNLEELHSFGKEHNKSNSALWEQRDRLIGFALLIKKTVVDEIGLLDEQFFPGNFEDDDWSLRMRLAGYKLLLCKDTFIHHFGSSSFSKEGAEKMNALLNINANKFATKWRLDLSEIFSISEERVKEIANSYNNKT